MSYRDVFLEANDDFFEHMGEDGRYVNASGHVRDVRLIIHDDLGMVEPVATVAGSKILIDVQKPTSAQIRSGGYFLARDNKYAVQRIEEEDETQITVSCNR